MAKDNVLDLLSLDIGDPTDFPPRDVALGLRELDSALRCKICSEFYDAPVVLACGHCFCSLCTRTEILTKAQCPTCRKETSEAQLRVNSYMEEVVEAWKSSRELVLRLTKAEAERLKAPTTIRKAKSNGTNQHKKRKRSPSLASDSDIELLETPPVAGPSSPRFSRVNNSRFFSSKTPSSRENSVDDLQSHVDQPIRSSSATDPADNESPCPICGKIMLRNLVGVHIDEGCKTPPAEDDMLEQKQKQEWANLFAGAGAGTKKRKGKDRAGPDGECLPTVSYAIIKEKQIRELLAEHGLPTTGDRATLTARHMHWVSLWNSNLDHSPAHRKRIGELRAELKRWEEVRSNGTKKASNGSKAVMKDTTEYQRQNGAQFKQLIAQARASRPKVVAGA